MIDLDMTQQIRESNLIEALDSAKADKQSLEAWEWLRDQLTLTKGITLELHRRIMEGYISYDCLGEFRNVDVSVGNQPVLRHDFVEIAMTDWLEQLSGRQPKQAHIEFEKIHPFVDGNGRVGRMLMWWHEVKLGHEPTLLLNAKKQDYYRWFKAATVLL